MKCSLFLLFIVAICGCNQITVLTSKFHEPRARTKEEVFRYLRKERLDAFQVVRFREGYNNSLYSFYLNLGLFNKTGNYIPITSDRGQCTDESFIYNAVKYVLMQGDSSMIDNEIVEHVMVLKDTANASYVIDQIEEGAGARVDSSYFIRRVDTFDVRLDLYTPTLVSFYGEDLKTDNLFSKYLIFQEFSLSGEPAVFAIYLRRLKNIINALNKEFDNSIKMVLINRDQIIE